jgi:hypothetical protein
VAGVRDAGGNRRGVREVDRTIVSDMAKVFVEIGNLAKNHKAVADHAVDFDPPIYNIWKQQEKTAGSRHFGNSEVRWVDNLLYLYTQPFDVVVDPFAGARLRGRPNFRTR